MEVKINKFKQICKQILKNNDILKITISVIQTVKRKIQKLPNC